MPARKYPRGSTWTGSEEQDAAIANAIMSNPVAQSVQNFGDSAANAITNTIEKTTVIVQQAKNTLADNLQGVISSTMDIAKKAVPTALAASASVQYLGGTPSFASFLQPWNLRNKFLLVADDRSSKIGYPLERTRQLSALSGFVMCENVRLEIPGTANASGATLEEQQLIKQYLENGCFLE